jgi:predicted small lipoprotein YifL
MKIVVTMLLLLGIATSLNACGKRGNPEAPNFQQAQ